MLKPAQLYKQQIIEKFYETFYDDEYKYYYDLNPGVPDIPDRPDNLHQFASVDKDGNVLGYMSYHIYSECQRANCFGIITFNKGKPNLEFMTDIRQMIEDCFCKFGLRSIEWFCYQSNTRVLHMYRHFIKAYGGREVGILRDTAKSWDGKIGNSVIFEVHRDDLLLYPDASGKLRMHRRFEQSALN